MEQCESILIKKIFVENCKITLIKPCRSSRQGLLYIDFLAKVPCAQVLHRKNSSQGSFSPSGPAGRLSVNIFQQIFVCHVQILFDLARHIDSRDALPVFQRAYVLLRSSDCICKIGLADARILSDSLQIFREYIHTVYFTSI